MPKPRLSKNPSTVRNRTRYRERREQLVEEMGGCCHYCGAGSHLEFHHLHKRSWVARDLSRWSRIKRYEEEWSAGLIVLACRVCNATRGEPEHDPVYGDDGQAVPF